MTTNNLEMPMWPIVFRLLFSWLLLLLLLLLVTALYPHTYILGCWLAVLPQQMETRQKLNKKENRFGPTKYFIPLIRCRVRNVEDYKDAIHIQPLHWRRWSRLRSSQTTMTAIEMIIIRGRNKEFGITLCPNKTNYAFLHHCGFFGNLWVSSHPSSSGSGETQQEHSASSGGHIIMECRHGGGGEQYNDNIWGKYINTNIHGIS